jgi:hypothetical protein
MHVEVFVSLQDLQTLSSNVKEFRSVCHQFNMASHAVKSVVELQEGSSANLQMSESQK